MALPNVKITSASQQVSGTPSRRPSVPTLPLINIAKPVGLPPLTAKSGRRTARDWSSGPLERTISAPSPRVLAENQKYEAALDLMASARQAALMSAGNIKSETGISTKQFLEETKSTFGKDNEAIKQLMEELKTHKFDSGDADSHTASNVKAMAKRRAQEQEEDQESKQKRNASDARRKIMKYLMLGKPIPPEDLAAMLDRKDTDEDLDQSRQLEKTYSGKDFHTINLQSIRTPRDQLAQTHRDRAVQHEDHIKEVLANKTRLMQMMRDRREHAIEEHSSERTTYPSIYLRLQRQKWEDLLIKQFDELLGKWFVYVATASRASQWFAAVKASRESRALFDKQTNAVNVLKRSMRRHADKMKIKRRHAARQVLVKALSRYTRLWRLENMIRSARKLRTALKCMKKRTNAVGLVTKCTRSIQYWWRQKRVFINDIYVTGKDMVLAEATAILDAQKKEKAKARRLAEAAKKGKRPAPAKGRNAKPKEKQDFTGDTPPVPDRICLSIARGSYVTRRLEYLRQSVEAQAKEFVAWPARIIPDLAKDALGLWEKELFEMRLNSMLSSADVTASNTSGRKSPAAARRPSPPPTAPAEPVPVVMGEPEQPSV